MLMKHIFIYESIIQDILKDNVKVIDIGNLLVTWNMKSISNSNLAWQNITQPEIQ